MQHSMRFLAIVVIIPMLISCSQDKGLSPDDTSNSPVNGVSLTLSHKPGNDREVKSKITLSFNLLNAGNYQVRIMGLTGYLMKEFNGFAEAGNVRIEWNLENEDGAQVNDTWYIAEFSVNNYVHQFILKVLDE